MAIYTDISLWQLSKQLQDSIALVQMISFNECRLNAKQMLRLLVVF